MRNDNNLDKKIEVVTNICSEWIVTFGKYFALILFALVLAAGFKLVGDAFVDKVPDAFADVLTQLLPLAVFCCAIVVSHKLFWRGE